MMFKSCFDNNVFVTYKNEVVNEEDKLAIISITVKNISSMEKIASSILTTTAAEDSEFGAEVRKIYFLEEEELVPAVSWSIYVWGDLDAAKEALTTILNKRVGPPKPPSSLGFSPSASSSIKKKITREGSAKRVETTIPLPHARGNRNKNPDDVIKVSEHVSGTGATVLTVKG